MSKLSKDIHHALNWLATEYYFLQKLHKHLEEAEEHKKDQEALKFFKKGYRDTRNIGRAERIVEEDVVKEIETLRQARKEKIDVRDVNKLLEEVEIPANELLKNGSMYLGSLRKQLKSIRSKAAINRKHPDSAVAQEVHQEVEELNIKINKLVGWIAALEVGFKKAEPILEMHTKDYSKMTLWELEELQKENESIWNISAFTDSYNEKLLSTELTYEECQQLGNDGFLPSFNRMDAVQLGVEVFKKDLALFGLPNKLPSDWNHDDPYRGVKFSNNNKLNFMALKLYSLDGDLPSELASFRNEPQFKDITTKETDSFGIKRAEKVLLRIFRDVHTYQELMDILKLYHKEPLFQDHIELAVLFQMFLRVGMPPYLIPAALLNHRSLRRQGPEIQIEYSTILAESMLFSNSVGYEIGGQHYINIFFSDKHFNHFKIPGHPFGKYLNTTPENRTHVVEEKRVTLDTYNKFFPAKANFTVSARVLSIGSGMDINYKDGSGRTYSSDYAALELLACFANMTKKGWYSIHMHELGASILENERFLKFIGFKVVSVDKPHGILIIYEKVSNKTITKKQFDEWIRKSKYKMYSK
jgi:hypothetical protein